MNTEINVPIWSNARAVLREIAEDSTRPLWLVRTYVGASGTRWRLYTCSGVYRTPLDLTTWLRECGVRHHTDGSLGPTKASDPVSMYEAILEQITGRPRELHSMIIGLDE